MRVRQRELSRREMCTKGVRCPLPPRRGSSRRRLGEFLGLGDDLRFHNTRYLSVIEKLRRVTPNELGIDEGADPVRGIL